MRLTIETGQLPGDHSTYIAMVAGQNELWANGGFARATSERRAVIDAVNAYFTRQDEREAAKSLQLDPRPVVPPAGSDASLEPTASLSLNVAVTPERIHHALQAAIGEDQTKLRMTYQKPGEDSASVRDILPLRLEKKRHGFGHFEDYLVAIDLDADEPKTFRLDRIKRIER